MNSWSMFNAYHSAYIGARGVMALLGIGLPFLPNGGQLLVDAYPQPESSKNVRKVRLGLWRFQEILIVRLPQLDQRALWQGLQRVLRISDVQCWDPKIRQELLDVAYERVTVPRNAFLYKAAFWPGDDLLVDRTDTNVARFVGTELIPEHEGFLIRLSFVVYRLFEQLILDLAGESGVIRAQVQESRVVKDPAAAELARYNAFLAHLTSQDRI
jgi:hypothetical protein